MKCALVVEMRTFSELFPLMHNANKLQPRKLLEPQRLKVSLPRECVSGKCFWQYLINLSRLRAFSSKQREFLMLRHHKATPTPTGNKSRLQKGQRCSTSLLPSVSYACLGRFFETGPAAAEKWAPLQEEPTSKRLCVFAIKVRRYLLSRPSPSILTLHSVK